MSALLRTTHCPDSRELSWLGVGVVHRSRGLLASVGQLAMKVARASAKLADSDALRQVGPLVAAQVLAHQAQDGQLRPIFQPPVTRPAGVTLLGYSDTGYGRRPYEDVVRDLRRHREWYGTQGAFFDQVPSGTGESGHYERLTTAARTLGCVTLALNHGTPPHPAYAALADLLVTFEGPWAAYLRTPPQPRHYPAGVRVCHLVYGVPPDADMAGAARERGATVHCAVPGTGAHPWGTLPHGLDAGG